MLDEGLTHPFTLISAPAGFGKTILLSTWAQSLQARGSRLCWISLDEEDNEPRLFWSYVLTALSRQCPERFQPLLMHLQAQPPLPLKSLLTALINVLAEGTDHFVLILDDYQVITEEQVHTTLAYLVEHLPSQLRIIIATRADPPLPLPMQRARQHMLEVRTDQLRCTAEEVKAFFGEVMGIQMPEETIQEVTTRTEGWLVGLQLLGLSLPEQANPATLLQEVSGDQCYILDYLTEEVLQRQPQDVQMFLLCTSILKQLSAALCNAVMQQVGSQEMLQRLEQANLFVVSLDNKRQWYRYHALFAEALQHQLRQTHADFVPTLHHRASLWYAEHDQTTEAILHAFKAHQWQWAADLIERKSLSLMSYTWGASSHVLILLQEWLGQLPAEVMHARPLLCYASSALLLQVAPFSMLHGWLDAAEATLTAATETQTHVDAPPTMLPPHILQEQQNLLGGVLNMSAALRSYEGDGWTALALCEQALTLVSADNLLFRSYSLLTQALACCFSNVNDTKAGVQLGLQAVSLARDTGQLPLFFNNVGIAAMYMIGAGQLHEIQRLTQQAILLGKQPGKPVLPEIGFPITYQAEVQREWNQLDTALTLAEEAISLYKQAESMASLVYLLCCYSVLLRVYLSRAELDAAYSVLEQIQYIGTILSQPFYLHTCAYFITIDQIRLWLACGELDRATCWAEALDVRERHSNPFICQQEEVARIRVLLAKHQPDRALERLGPVLQRATTGKRWGHVIEMCLLQALAHQMLQEEVQALDALSEAVRLAEPEGYIRSFVDEGPPMEILLYGLRKRERKRGPTPYLDILIAAFQQEWHRHQRKNLPKPISCQSP